MKESLQHRRAFCLKAFGLSICRPYRGIQHSKLWWGKKCSSKWVKKQRNEKRYIPYRPIQVCAQNTEKSYNNVIACRRRENCLRHAAYRVWHAESTRSAEVAEIACATCLHRTRAHRQPHVNASRCIVTLRQAARLPVHPAKLRR